MNDSLWRFVGEEFDNNLPRMTAVYVKESVGARAFAYPSGDARCGYLFDFSARTSYDLPPTFRFDFAAYEFPGAAGGVHENRALFVKQTYYPSLFVREIEFANLPLCGTERFGMAQDGALSLRYDFQSRAEWYPFQKTLFSVLYADTPFSVSEKDGYLHLQFDDLDYYLASESIESFGLFSDDRNLLAALSQDKLTCKKRGHYLVLRHTFDLAARDERTLQFGFSSMSGAHALSAAKIDDLEKRAQAAWLLFLNALPKPAFRDEREKKAYYKSWVTIRNNYYDHESWGHSITESLPVYKGLWQWAISAVEWHDDQNPEYPSVWFKKAMDMLVASQREDGYITHAIYVDETHPGERWEKRGTIQTPHLPWAALRYYHATGDLESIEAWFEPLLRYYDYICRTLDEKFLGLHLWAITSSYDSGVDTAAVFQRVTYGEANHAREPYCYPTIFAAERYRYELSIAALCALTGRDPKPYLDAAQLTLVATEKHLWDKEKKWYGVLHADGTLDTRVGVDGLFVYVYNMVDRTRAAEMKDNFAKLLGPYGVRTLAKDEPGFRADVYWRGPCWPKSASLGMHAAQKFYPDLAERCRAGILNFALRHPNIWECMDVDTGNLAHGDVGYFCSPGMSSNVGAGDILGAIFATHGFDFYAMEMPLPLCEIENFRHAGLRLSIRKDKDGSFRVRATAAPQKKATLSFYTQDGIELLEIADGEEKTIKHT